MSRRKFSVRYVDPQDFRDVRKVAGMTRREAAKALDVTPRTIQNWETGSARIPWMAIRMLRILGGFALPGESWEGWTIHGNRLYAPNGRWYEANQLAQIEHVFGMARLWHQDYVKRCKWPAAVILPFPAVLTAPERTAGTRNAPDATSVGATVTKFKEVSR